MKERYFTNAALRLMMVLFALNISITVLFAADIEQKAEIIAGPYLLAPTDKSMTVMWETDKPVDSFIRYGTSDAAEKKLGVKMYRGTPWEKNPKGLCMFRASLNDLQPDTDYLYNVTTSAGEKIVGGFKTLKEDPKDISFFVITDTHNFGTAKELTAAILKAKPDFIIHTGDMVLGTGYSKAEFNKYWFNKAADFLKYIPVIYAPGNHDHGPYVEDYFTKAQSAIYHANKTGNSVSFNYGNVHFVIIDSNPWALQEMGAVKAGLPVDKDTKKLVKDSLDWLRKDLSSEAAKKAEWRILFMHHPYVDDMTRKYIADIAEEYNVNVLFAGHKHKYFKNVSLNPKVGARLLYVDLPAALSHETGVSFTKKGTPVVPGYPEIAATGLGDYASVDISGDALNIKIHSLANDGQKNIVLDNIEMVNEAAKLGFSNIQISPDSVKSGDDITIKADVKNEGRGIAAVLLKIKNNGKNIEKYVLGKKGREQVIFLNPGEKKEVETCIPLYTTGKHAISFAGKSVIVNVEKQPSYFVYRSMNISVSSADRSDLIVATIEVQNKGNEKGKVSVPFSIDGKLCEEKELVLAPFETRIVNFAYKFDRSGIYTVKIGDSKPQKIRILGEIKGTPLVVDISGHNNNGIIRGNPILVDCPTGKALKLDGENDYIEIPDSNSLRFKTGWTGLVLAKPDRLAKPDGKDHNPLLQKGPSIGWGPNYLVRMAMRRTGLMTWGTSVGTTEFFWDGGKIPVGKWSQYTASFDRGIGGKGYIDTEKVAETKVYGKVGPIQNWKGYPLFCGFSYIGHVDKDKKRALQYTFFPGEIGEIRFYDKGLDTESIDSIYKKPNVPGINKKDMVVWLNFEKINTSGTYTTEWKRPAVFIPSYKGDTQQWNWKELSAKVNVPGNASIEVSVQVSDDEETVKDSKVIKLKNGLNKYDISGLRKGQFVRTVSTFSSSLAVGKTTDIPVLDEYEITAFRDGDMNHVLWSTKTDWEKGEFKGAVGFIPEDRLDKDGVSGVDFYH
jgi:predicted phosphodiesterase